MQLHQTRSTVEQLEHKSLKEKLKAIALASGFSFDSEIALNFSDGRDKDNNLLQERSIDFAFYGSQGSKRFLFLFECKSGKKLREVNKEIGAWERDTQKMRSRGTRVVSSDHNRIKSTDVNKAEFIKVCFVVGEKYDEAHFEELHRMLERHSFVAWDSDVLKYYQTIASTVKRWMSFEILREFGVSLEATNILKRRAVEVRQGDNEMYLMALSPSVLLRIGYVSRRASGTPDAYQRILNKDRINRISSFLQRRDALLPNAIIIAFDESDEIQSQIRYDKGNLYFPNTYCSAWIIDGQHRVFGFSNTRLSGSSEDDESFLLPVVAFRNLDLTTQSRTFVDINYNQKKIDPTLLCAIATSVGDLRNELTWPSLLVTELNNCDPLKNKVKVGEMDRGRPISLASFAQYGLLEGLLGFDRKSREYSGPLCNLAGFNVSKAMSSKSNESTFSTHVGILRRFFHGVHKNTQGINQQSNPWVNPRKSALLKPTGINALLLVLARILKAKRSAAIDFDKCLAPLSDVDFSRNTVADLGGGWKGFRNLANIIIGKLNTADPSLRLEEFRKREKV